MTWLGVEARAAEAVLVIAVGATEQQGPHLPVSTDTDIATALAGAVAKQSRQVVVARAGTFGSSGEHQDFPETISIGAEVLEFAVVELGRPASRRFGRSVLVSTHGGNAVPVAAATGRLCQGSRDVVVRSPPWEGDAHAGRIETSVMLALHPERDALSRAEPGSTGALAELMPALRVRGVHPISRNGVLGDPAGASAEQRREPLRGAIAELHAVVREV